ncbi:WXG100 family type VII secretion target [Lacrimispora indolis]|uniref:WXG100 family type VII secretion target n=1 Tax=Lacrimispora indolis TaxID=69825 RepID=UPI00042190BB|nr:WXG100 family type VII secretion target [[Clostridium] methoxybenzovorans]
MALRTDNTDFIVDMSSILTGISSYQTMIQNAEKIVEDIEAIRNELPQKYWSGISRDEFDNEVTLRRIEIQKLIDQMNETQKSLSYLLKQANIGRKDAIFLKTLLT